MSRQILPGAVLAAWACMVLLLAGCTVRKTLGSPEGNVQAELRVENGVPYMDVSNGFGQKLLTVRLGMNTSEGRFDRKVKIEGQVEAEKLQGEYALHVGKQSLVRYNQYGAVYKLVNDGGYRMEVEVRVGNDGVAFRYRIPAKRNIRVEDDFTTYYFPAASVGFLQPMLRNAGKSVEGNFNYEAEPVIEVPLSVRSEERRGWCYPALVKAPVANRTYWALVGETGVRGNYCATHLADADSLGGLQVAYPVEEETQRTQYPTFNGATPWRTIVVTNELKALVENTWTTDLVKEEIDVTKTYHPGRAAWSWLTQQNEGTVYEQQLRYIDLADRLGFEYCLIDAYWDSQIGYELLDGLVRYARQKQVGIWVWYDSDALYTPAQRRREMAYLKQIGVYGIKVDFRGGDEQASMRLYESLLCDANDYGLAVNLHGSTVPRGWERIYPNLLTSEAVMGMQYAVADKGYEQVRARHITYLAFTRNVAGPVDYTPMVLNRRLGADPQRGLITRSTTLAFELALPVILFSGVQHYGLTPENLEEFPGYVFDYLSNVPATWDETRFLAGYPGRYVVLARRSGPRWFVAAINAQDETIEIPLDLSFIPQPEMCLLEANGKNGVVRETIVPSSDVKLRLRPNDGEVLYPSGF